MLESDMNVFDEKNEATIFCLRIGKRNSEVNEIGIGYSIFALSKCFSVDFQKKNRRHMIIQSSWTFLWRQVRLIWKKNNVWSHCNPNLSYSANGPRESRQIDQNLKKPTNFITGPHRFYNIQSSNAKISLVRNGNSFFSLLGPFWTLCSLTNCFVSDK